MSHSSFAYDLFYTLSRGLVSLLLTLTPACSCVYNYKFQFRPIHPPSRRLSHLVLPLAALVDERDLEQRAHIGAFAGQGYEERDVGSAVLGALPVGVEVDRPVEPPHVEGLGGDELPQLGSGVRDRRRGGRRRRRIRCGGAMGGQSKPKLLIIAWDPL